MVAATTITTAAIDDIPAGNVQGVLGTVYGKAQYAANNVGAALYDANLAKDIGNAAQGIATDASGVAYAAKGQLDNYVAPLVGKLDSEMSQIFTELGLTRS
ncbi:hypothetical protein G3A39_40505 [Paraburkholderia aspalathi]|nr:hypothetical protein [Paraburkholderia aspalathi]